MDSVTPPNKPTNKPKSPLVTPTPAPSVEPEPKPAPQTIDPSQPNRQANKDPFGWFKSHKRITAVIIALIVLIPVGIWAYFQFVAKDQPVTQEQSKKAPEPAKPITSPLTGNVVAASVLEQPVYGVVIENSPSARPQSSLSQAGVVYEAVAEGGITRFIAIYLDEQPANIGPVRSLRPYFVDWSQEYNQAPVAHAGGSFDALTLARQVGMKSMNGLNYGAFFQRVRDRYAPHNLYTNTTKLIGLMNKYGWYTKPQFEAWARKADAPEATPTHPAITVTFSSPLYTAKYDYVAACNCYNRTIGGKAHIERNTGKQIQTKNVVVMTVQTTYDRSGRALMTTTGSGKAVVFRDGGAVVGTWKKESRTGRTKFLDANGAEIPLNAGNTWVGVIPQTGSVVY